jgi:orotate phosphoribosyltransferase/signal transduction histidine kinase
MSIENLIIRKGDILEIKLQSTVDLESFELLLKKAYGQSKQAIFKTIILNFGVVRWIDLLQLSIISQWILELKALDKEVQVIYPSNQTVISFLDNYHFSHFLNANAIFSDRETISLSYNFADRPYLPLTFLDSEGYIKILSDLSNPKIYTTLFEDVSYALVGTKAILRDIVIKELGDNMQIHGEARLSNMIVTRIARVPQEDTRKPLQKNMLDSVTDKPHIVVVISDKGKGIFKLLKNAYLQDTILKVKVQDPNCCDLIEYSTLEHATSRTADQRLSTLKSLISAEMEDMNPFTGLFQVRQLVKKYMGILTIRSGNSFVIFNYYQRRGKIILFRSDNIQNYKALANFGGTQVKVVLPILDNYKEIEDKLYGNFNIQEAEEQINYEYLSVSEFFGEAKTEDEMLTACEALMTTIKRKSMERTKNSMVLDLKTNQLSLDTKLKVLLIWHLMKCQEMHENEKAHVLIYCDPSLITLINDSLENRSFFINRPIIAFNSRLQRDVIGVHSEERKTFYKIQRIGTFDADESFTNFANKYKSLFIYDRQTDTWNIKHNRQLILATVRDSIEQRLYDIIINPENKIYHADVKVLGPNGIYFDKYFEIYTLFDNAGWRYLIKQWLELQLHEIKPDYIITITRAIGNCATELIAETEIGAVKKIVHVNLRTPRDINRKDVSDLLYPIKETASVVVCTDVIATGRSLQELLDSLIGISVKRCLCIASTLQTQEVKYGNSGEMVPIISIVQKPAKGYFSKPRDWVYNEIHEVNRETHKIYTKSNVSPDNDDGYSIFRSPLENYRPFKTTEKIPSPGDPLYSELIEDYINPFFENLIIPKQAFLLKMISNGRYMPVFYNIPVLLKEAEEEIKADLNNSIARAQEHHGIPITRFVTAGQEQDYKQLISFILNNFPSVLVDHISYNHLNHYYSSDDFSGRGIIVIDDAFITGENYFRILEYYSNKNAALILVYVLIKRSSDKVAARLKNIKRFGNMIVEFKYLFEGRIPIYTEANNPIIKSISEYEDLLSKFWDFPIAGYIKERIDSLQYKDTKARVIAVNPSDSNAAGYIRLRWKLEYAKKDIGVRKKLALLFEESANNNEDVLLLFSILIEEKYNFIYNKAFADSFFYPKFTEKILNTCSRLLTNKKLNLSLNDIANTLEIGFVLSPDWFSRFIDYELIDFLDNDSIIHAITGILCLGPKDYRFAKIKSDFLQTIQSGKNTGDKQQEFFLLLKRIWGNEEAEISRYDLNKAKYIKELLKSSFHDLSQKVQNLKTYIRSDEREAYSIFTNMIRYVQEESKGFINLFMGGNYNEVRTIIDGKLKALNNSLTRSLKMIDLINESSLSDYAYLLPDYADEILDCLLSDDGIVKILEKLFRTNVKQEFTMIFNPLIEKQGKKVILRRVSESCLAFCIPNDFRDIIANIRENILKHSKADKVMVDIKKVRKESNIHMIQIDIYDDGKSTDKISESHGVNKCDNLCKSYSGSFKIGKLEYGHEEHAQGYRTFASIELHDLSADILKLPNHVK